MAVAWIIAMWSPFDALPHPLRTLIHRNPILWAGAVLPLGAGLAAGEKVLTEGGKCVRGRVCLMQYLPSRVAVFAAQVFAAPDRTVSVQPARVLGGQAGGRRVRWVWTKRGGFQAWK